MAEKTASVSRAVLAGVALLLVLYPLGIGPMWWWAAQSSERMDIYLKVYAPLTYVMRKSKLVDTILEGYCHLWFNPLGIPPKP
jgi:hypothetical protein